MMQSNVPLSVYAKPNDYIRFLFNAMPVPKTIHKGEATGSIQRISLYRYFFANLGKANSIRCFSYRGKNQKHIILYASETSCRIKFQQPQNGHKR